MNSVDSARLSILRYAASTLDKLKVKSGGTP